MNAVVQLDMFRETTDDDIWRAELSALEASHHSVSKDLFSQKKDNRNWMYRCGREAEQSIQIGNRYGFLTVEEKIYDGDYLYKCICKCDCGNKTAPWARSLKNGATVSCGCYGPLLSRTRNRKHGKKNSRVYWTWNSMKDRCTNPKNVSYNRYGGRGITYDPRWEDFDNFYLDMGDPPKRKSLERIDNDKGYSKENCRWATWDEQAKNRSSSFIVEYKGEKLNVFDIWKMYVKPTGLGCSSFYRRLHKGMSIEDAVQTSPRPGRSKGSTVSSIQPGS